MQKIKSDDWSNIVYVIGAACLYQTPILALAMFSLGFTSFMAHWKGGGWWKWDWFSMFVTFGAIAVHNLELSWLWLIPVAGIAFKWGTNNYVLFATFFLASVISAHLAGLAIIPSLLLFGAGLACQRYAEAAQDHNSLRYQIFHSLWHPITMIAIVLLVA